MGPHADLSRLLEAALYFFFMLYAYFYGSCVGVGFFIHVPELHLGFVFVLPDVAGRVRPKTHTDTIFTFSRTA
jgi:hypothetical protein